MLKKNELLRRIPIAHKPEDIEFGLEEFCNRANVSFQECTDSATKRQFLMNFIERITYRNDRVTVEGSIPIGTSKIEFVIKRAIDRVKLRDELLEHDRKVGRRGTPVRRDHFGHLLAEAKVLSPKL